MKAGRSARAPPHRRDPAFHRAAAALSRRRASSSAWRSSASAARRPTRRSCRPCATATTCGSTRSASSPRTRAASSSPSSRPSSAATWNTTSRPTSRSSSTASRTTRSTGSRSCASSGATSRPRSARRRSCARREVLDALNELLGPHIFPDKGDGSNPRTCPSCGTGQLSLKLGKFGAFIGCSNYPECKFTRQLAATGANGDGEGDVRERRPAGRAGSGRRSGDGPAGDAARRALRSLRPARRRREAQALLPAEGHDAGFASTSTKALKLLALPREVARHPESGEPILAGIGRYGPYVQHGKTYANLGRDDDVLEIGGNRAIDLIVAKESGRWVPPRRRRSRPPARRGSGERHDDRRQGRPFRSLRDGRRRPTPRLPRALVAGSRDARRGDLASRARRAAGGSKKGARKVTKRAAPAKKAATKKAAAKKATKAGSKTVATKTPAKAGGAKKPAAKKAGAR